MTWILLCLQYKFTREFFPQPGGPVIKRSFALGFCIISENSFIFFSYMIISSRAWGAYFSIHRSFCLYNCEFFRRLLVIVAPPDAVLISSIFLFLAFFCCISGTVPGMIPLWLLLLRLLFPLLLPPAFLLRLAGNISSSLKDEEDDESLYSLMTW